MEKFEQQKKQKIDEIIEVGKYLWQRKIIAGIDGNISVKIAPNLLLITASGKSLGFLNRSDFIEMNIDTKNVIGFSENKPSSEINLHFSCIESNSSIRSIIHTHPPFATALSTISKGIIEPTLTNIIIQFGTIPVIPYSTPASKELGEEIAKYVKKGYRAMLLEHHGILALGNSLMDAYFITEQIEHLSQTVLIAKLGGTPLCISKSNIRQLMELRNRFNISSPNPILPNNLMCLYNSKFRKIGYWFFNRNKKWKKY